MPTEDSFNNYNDPNGGGDDDEISVIETQLGLAINSTKSVIESYISRPVAKTNLPEVLDLSINFIYNYYTSNERTVEINNDISLDNVGIADATYIVNATNINSSPLPPRMLQIEFIKPAFERSGLISDNNGSITAININSINYETAIHNKTNAGFELYDTGKEKKIYKMLKANAFFRNIDLNLLSQKEAVDQMYDLISEKGGLKGDDKKILYDALNNLQEEGYEIAPVDTPRDIALTSKDPMSSAAFGVQVNLGQFANLLDASNILNDTVFGDELRRVESLAGEIQSTITRNINYSSANVSDLDYAFDFIPYAETVVTDDVTNFTEEIQNIIHIGYIIEKSKIDKNGTTIKLKTEICYNTNKTIFKDSEVRYGKTYRYKIRTLFAINANVIDRGEGKLITYLFASEGKMKTVVCKETVPPPPPEGLRFKFDYRNLLPHIHWQFPVNKQRDIKKFQVFKRYSVNQPFVLLAEIDFDNSTSRTVYNEQAQFSNYYRVKSPVLSFLDKTHREGEKPIYAVACVDAHGLTSNYSAQYRIERDPYTNIVKRTLISRKNAPKPYPNLYLNRDAFQDMIRSSGNNRIKIFFDPEYYRVFKNKEPGNNSEEKDVNLLAIDRNNYRYNFNFINIDNGKSQQVLVKIIDDSFQDSIDQNYFEAGGSKIADFNPANFTFN